MGGNSTSEGRRVAGNRGPLAVAAPREVRILRGELKEAALAFEEPEPAPTAIAPLPTTSAETVVVTHQRLTGLHTMPHALG